MLYVGMEYAKNITGKDTQYSLKDRGEYGTSPYFKNAIYACLLYVPLQTPVSCSVFTKYLVRNVPYTYLRRVACSARGHIRYPCGLGSIYQAKGCCILDR